MCLWDWPEAKDHRRIVVLIIVPYGQNGHLEISSEDWEDLRLPVTRRNDHRPDWKKEIKMNTSVRVLADSVTKLGNLLRFGQLLKAYGSTF